MTAADTPRRGRSGLSDSRSGYRADGSRVGRAGSSALPGPAESPRSSTTVWGFGGGLHVKRIGHVSLETLMLSTALSAQMPSSLLIRITADTSVDGV